MTRAGRRASDGAAEEGDKGNKITKSAFAFFKNEEMPKLLQQHTEVKGCNFVVISKHLSTMWKDLSDEAKRKYTDMAFEAKSAQVD